MALDLSAWLGACSKSHSFLGHVRASLEHRRISLRSDANAARCAYVYFVLSS